MKCQSEYIRFHTRKSIRKCWLYYGSHFGLASVCRSHVPISARGLDLHVPVLVQFSISVILILMASYILGLGHHCFRKFCVAFLSLFLLPEPILTLCRMGPYEALLMEVHFIQENSFEQVVCKISILFEPQWLTFINPIQWQIPNNKSSNKLSI